MKGHGRLSLWGPGGGGNSSTGRLKDSSFENKFVIFLCTREDVVCDAYICHAS